MNAPELDGCDRGHGGVELIEVPRERWPESPINGLLERKLLCRWQPPEEIVSELPSWYDLCLCCDVAKDGSRRFSPLGADLATIDSPSDGMRYVSTPEGLLAVASIGGEALLACRGTQEPVSLLTCREARLFCQYVSHMREHLGPTIKLAKAIGICRSARPDMGTKHILPPDLGLDRQGRGRPWGPRELRYEGRLVAERAGDKVSTIEHIMRLGFFAAAVRNPLDVPDAETNSLVRMTLFDLGSSDAQVDSAGLAYVADHVRASLQDHLAESSTDFERWIQDPKAGLVRRISKRKDCRLNRSQVRATLLQLGWHATVLFGRCVGAQLTAFRDALPVPLAAQDRRLFDCIFVGHPATGGLPLLLLQDRFPFLREAILHLWADPYNPQRIGIMHAMMYYYSTLINARRASDRQYKQRAGAKADLGTVPWEGTRPVEIYARTPVAAILQEVLLEAALRLAKEQHAISDPVPPDIRVEQYQLDGDRLTLRLCDDMNAIDVRVSTSRDSFIRLLRKHWMDRPFM